jgi:large subunit ribosomal protein L1
VSFDFEQLVANLSALSSEIMRARPAGSKGRYVQGLSVSSTMGPAVRVEVGRLDNRD